MIKDENQTIDWLNISSLLECKCIHLLDNVTYCASTREVYNNNC